METGWSQFSCFLPWHFSLCYKDCNIPCFSFNRDKENNCLHCLFARYQNRKYSVLFYNYAPPPKQKAKKTIKWCSTFWFISTRLHPSDLFSTLFAEYVCSYIETLKGRYGIGWKKSWSCAPFVPQEMSNVAHVSIFTWRVCVAETAFHFKRTFHEAEQTVYGDANHIMRYLRSLDWKKYMNDLFIV